VAGDGANYSDIDMMNRAGQTTYLHRDGTPYPEQKRRT
jgi:uncharacterized cupin superfamily protein